MDAKVEIRYTDITGAVHVVVMEEDGGLLKIWPPNHHAIGMILTAADMLAEHLRQNPLPD